MFAAVAMAASLVLSPVLVGATTYYSYLIVVSGGGTVNERSGPGTSYPIVGTLSNGVGIQIACQTSGSAVGSGQTTIVWDQLANGSYVSDYYTNTPVAYGFSPPIPQCGASAPPVTVSTSTPTAGAYLIVVSGGGTVNERSGPAMGYPIVGTVTNGATITVTCQAPGAMVASTSVWDRLSNGVYISDYYTNTPTVNGFTSSIPRCVSPPPATLPGGSSSTVGTTVTSGGAHLSTIFYNPFLRAYYCTWYVETMFHSYVRQFPALYKAPNTYLNIRGNAYTWSSYAAARGWTVTTTPTVNSIAVFQRGVEGSDGVNGHVAWVTAVRGGGHFTVSELNAENANKTENTTFTPDTNPYYHAASGVTFIVVPTS